MQRLLNFLITITAMTMLVMLVGCEDDPLSPVIENDEPVDSSNNARLTIENPVFDFGFAPQYSRVSHDFWLKSSGTDTLRILKVESG